MASAVRVLGGFHAKEIGLGRGNAVSVGGRSPVVSAAEDVVAAPAQVAPSPSEPRGRRLSTRRAAQIISTVLEQYGFMDIGSKKQAVEKLCGVQKYHVAFMSGRNGRRCRKR